MSGHFTEVINFDGNDFADLSRSILQKGLPLRFKAFGSSMHPFVKHGDIVVIEPLKSEGCRVGDIVLFQDRSGRMRLHRVIRKKKDESFIVKGDALEFTDGTVREENIYGKMLSVERNGVTVEYNSLKMRANGLALALLSPLSFVIYPVVKKIKKIFL
ncbi:MAG: signal peptidase I [Candidatus Schekmanbacteria bacterium]|nr:signal peptidase I [Candidatus Schekmanbacteria bacterium]